MFDTLGSSEQIDYLEDVLPRKPFEEAVGELNSNTDGDISNIISSGKEVIIAQMSQGRDHWEYLTEQRDTPKEDLKNDLSYSELAYYHSAMNDAGLETKPAKFRIESESRLSSLIDSGASAESIEEYLTEAGDESINKAFSRVGSDIWNGLGSEPTPRIAHFENSRHLYIEFWFRTGSKQQFHEREGEFLEFPVLRKIVSRVHLDQEFIEIRGRRDRKQDRESALIATKNLLNDDIQFSSYDDEFATDGGTEMEITDQTIRYFYNLTGLKRVSHANKQGTATSSWTAEEVRNDPRFPDDRPNNYNNLVFELDPVGKVSFQLNAENNSFRTFQHKIMPDDHRMVTEFIWENITDAPN